MADIGGVILGGALAIAGGAFTKWLEYRREVKSFRCGIRNEIAALIDIAEIRGYEAYFQFISSEWKAGVDRKFQVLGGKELDINSAMPVFSGNLAKIGMIGNDASGDVVRFYRFVNGILIDIRAFSLGETHDHTLTEKAQFIDNDLALWSEAKRIGNKAIAKLDDNTPAAFKWVKSIIDALHNKARR